MVREGFLILKQQGMNKYGKAWRNIPMTTWELFGASFTSFTRIHFLIFLNLLLWHWLCPFILQTVKGVLAFKTTCSLLAEAPFPLYVLVFAELTDGTKRDLCHGSKLYLIQPPSMVVDGGFRNACSLHCLLTVTWAHCISRIPLQLFRCHLVSPHK